MSGKRLRLLTNRSIVIGAIVVWSILLLGLSYKVGIQHDYGYYLHHWELVRAGLNPWTHNDSYPPNTYGPIYNLFAYLVSAQQLLPKLVLTLAFLVANIFLLLQLFRTRPEISKIATYLFLIPLNFLVISVVSIFGDNDSMVAALIAFAVVARFRNQLIAAGILLGLAMLLKYYPALLIPFFCLNQRRFVWKPAIAATITIALGGAIAWLTWGSDFLYSLTFGASRDATYLSPLFAFKSQAMFTSTPVVDFLIGDNMIFVLLVALASLAASYRLRFTWIEASATGLFVCLVTYKVGHAQFYLAWIVLLVGLLIQGDRRGKYMVYAFLPFVALIEVFQFSYFLRSNQFWVTTYPIDQNVGFAVLAIAIVTLVFIYFSRVMKHARAQSPNCSANLSA